MAENKNSALLYCDLIHTIEGLKDNEAGKVFKHFLRYINDLNPIPPDRLTEIVFEPIKQGLKRDLKKWENIKGKRSEAGKKSAEIKKQNSTKSTSVESVKQDSTKSTDSVSVIVSDSVNVKEINTKECLRENVFLHRKEFEKLRSQYSDDDVGWMLDKLSAYKTQNSKVYKSDYGAILNWVVDRLKEEKTKEKNSAKKENNGNRNTALANFGT